MQRDTIAIITEPADLHVDSVVRVLQARDVEVIRLHPEDFGSGLSISAKISNGRVTGDINNPYHSVQVERIASVWYRGIRTLGYPLAVAREAREHVVKQYRGLIRNLRACLDCHWVCDPLKLQVAELKALQLIEAYNSGLSVPPTLLTNSAERVDEFRREAPGGRCALKTFEAVGVQSKDGWRMPYTTVINDETPLESARLSPIIVQPYVEKKAEVRCVVIGDELFPAMIHNKGDGVPDWRMRHELDADGNFRDANEYSRMTLPSAVEHSIKKFIRAFQIDFASIDFIIDESDDFVFLDLNPNGQWLWLEHAVDLPLTERMADYLCKWIEQ